ncbi:subtilisin-like protease SBT5.3 [Selaginella moellendorffii]|uniref:subtilisin-like protease SBT5.3 n=1 Tax=Selaginella moellendorffii TaxID=88036 RepID=UPI000D1C65FA|nr:subtilisin-like protease SBT5.3 [Selaginella moellendorffii]|eukprot:XP_024525821.1 subtilisin-like protease SBT5.3 [Selaginella moellendorffii]
MQVIPQGTSLVIAESHPMHLHGFDFFVVRRGLGNSNSSLASTFNLLDPPGHCLMGEILTHPGASSILQFTFVACSEDAPSMSIYSNRYTCFEGLWNKVENAALLICVLCVLLQRRCFQLVEGMPEVLSVHPNRVRRLFTTRSWDFLGLPIDAESKAASLLSEHRILDEDSSDVIIGVLDTVPAKWKGSCVNDPKTNASVVVHCNRYEAFCAHSTPSLSFSEFCVYHIARKVIGAKYYRAGLSPNASVAYSNPRDFDGHGTGTASIGAGMAVANASMEGLASGTARGGLRSARISAYKVCWTFQCYDIDIVAALDDAIHDGVDVISLSLGDVPLPYNVDIIAIGAFHALEKGILVSCACGNSGPIKGTVTNIAPWILTVGASSIDREITP